MRLLKTALLIIGGLAALLGLIWIGQGTGYFPYPRTSFMINEAPWIYRGIGLGLAGLLIIFISRRL